MPEWKFWQSGRNDVFKENIFLCTCIVLSEYKNVYTMKLTKPWVEWASDPSARPDEGGGDKAAWIKNMYNSLILLSSIWAYLALAKVAKLWLKELNSFRMQHGIKSLQGAILN